MLERLKNIWAWNCLCIQQ